MTKYLQDSILETPREATGAENSKNSLVILLVSMAALIAVAIGLFWYFGMLPGMNHFLAGQPH
jgi:hypothetical protein